MSWGKVPRVTVPTQGFTRTTDERSAPVGVFNAAGTRLNLAGVTRADEADPLKVLAFDVYATEAYSEGDGGPVLDSKPEGSIKTLLAKAGTVIRESAVAAWFTAPTITSITPATGAAAGGDVVTIVGTDLDGVTGVTFDAVAGTAVTVVSSTQITVTTPAHAAGAVDVVVTTDGGAVTETDGFTYV